MKFSEIHKLILEDDYIYAKKDCKGPECSGPKCPRAVIPEKSRIFSLFKEPSYAEKVKSSLLHILMDHKQVSEKSFNEVDNLSGTIDQLFTKSKELRDYVDKCEKDEKRPSYTAENLFDQYKKDLM